MNKKNTIKFRDLVSVVIPTYNREQTILRAVNSVLNQTYNNIEVLIIDDGSKDNTQSKIEKLKDKRIFYFKLKKNGACHCRNYGIEKSNGEYIAFLDSDDEWMPDKIEKELEQIKKLDDEYAVVFSGAVKIKEKNKKIKLEYKGRIDNIYLEGLTKFNFNRIGNIKIFPSNSQIFVKKKCLLDIGMYDESLPKSQDFDLNLRLSKKYKYFYNDLVLSNIYYTEKSITTNYKNRLISENIIYNKHYKNQNSWIRSFGLLRLALAYYKNKKKKETIMYCMEGLKNNFFYFGFYVLLIRILLI